MQESGLAGYSYFILLKEITTPRTAPGKGGERCRKLLNGGKKVPPVQRDGYGYHSPPVILLPPAYSAKRRPVQLIKQLTEK